jgi:nitrate reductase NapE component
MKMANFTVLTSTEYGQGRIALFLSRFNNFHTDNTTVFPDFTRKTMEYVAIRDVDEVINVCVVSDFAEGTSPQLDDVKKIDVSRKDVSFLSDLVALSKFHCLILSGFGNNLSPLIRQNILSYVEDGGGLIVSDVNVTMANFELLDPVSPVYVLDSGFASDSGFATWTDSGIGHYIFEPEFSNMKIKTLNSVRDTDLGSAWEPLVAFDTEAVSEVEEQEEDIDEFLFIASDDFPIRGASFVGYYGSLYRDGLIDLKT